MGRKIFRWLGGLFKEISALSPTKQIGLLFGCVVAVPSLIAAYQKLWVDPPPPDLLRARVDQIEQSLKKSAPDNSELSQRVRLKQQLQDALKSRNSDAIAVAISASRRNEEEIIDQAKAALADLAINEADIKDDKAPDDSIALLEQTAKIIPDNPDLLLALGERLQRRGAKNARDVLGQAKSIAQKKSDFVTEAKAERAIAGVDADSGDVARAIEHLKAAIALFNAQVAAGTSVATCYSCLASCHMDLGLLLRAEKRNQEALQEYQNALAALDHVAKLQDSDEVDTARKTATTRSAIGRLKQGLKDTTGIADVEQALTGLEPLSRKFPKLQSLRATYIEVLQDLAEAYEDSGRIEDATRVMKRFQDWADANGAFFATSSEYEHVIPNGFSRSAGILAKAGKADAAIGAYERALLEYAKVKSPSQAFQINQIITRIFLADLFDGLGNTERKLSELRLAMQIAEKLIEKSDSVDPRVRYVDAAYRVFMETPSKPLAETINRHLGWLESRIDLSDYQEAKTQIRNYIDEN